MSLWWLGLYSLVACAVACVRFITTPVLAPGKLCFLPGRGPVLSRFQKTGAGLKNFFNTGAGAGPGLTKFTYTGAGFVEKYRILTGAGAAETRAPVGS